MAQRIKALGGLVGRIRDEEIVELAKEGFLCQACLTGDRDWELILCDACNKAFHIDCHEPPLPVVPEWSWFCNSCSIHHVPRAIETPVWRMKQPPSSLRKSSKTSPSLSSSSLPNGIRLIASSGGTRFAPFEGSESSEEELTDDEFYAKNHAMLEVNQRKERVSRKRTRQPDVAPQFFVYRNERKRERRRSVGGPLLGIPEEWIAPLNVPTEDELVSRARLLSRDLFRAIQRKGGFCSDKIENAVQSSAENIHIVRSFTEMDWMHVELGEEETEKVQQEEDECMACGSFSRPWSFRHCLSCGAVCHLECMEQGWQSVYNQWHCVTCTGKAGIGLAPFSALRSLHSDPLQPVRSSGKTTKQRTPKKSKYTLSTSAPVKQLHATPNFSTDLNSSTKFIPKKGMKNRREMESVVDEIHLAGLSEGGVFRGWDLKESKNFAELTLNKHALVCEKDLSSLLPHLQDGFVVTPGWRVLPLQQIQNKENTNPENTTTVSVSTPSFLSPPSPLSSPFSSPLSPSSSPSLAPSPPSPSSSPSLSPSSSSSSSSSSSPPSSPILSSLHDPLEEEQKKNREKLQWLKRSKTSVPLQESLPPSLHVYLFLLKK